MGTKGGEDEEGPPGTMGHSGGRNGRSRDRKEGEDKEKEYEDENWEEEDSDKKEQDGERRLGLSVLLKNLRSKKDKELVFRDM